jgi:hypothetical protein
MSKEIEVSESVKQQMEKISKEDIMTIYTGKRPEHIDYGVYRSIKSFLDSMNKERMRGTLIHCSNAVLDKDGDKEVWKYTSKGITYRNETNK